MGEGWTDGPTDGWTGGRMGALKSTTASNCLPTDTDAQAHTHTHTQTHTHRTLLASLLLGDDATLVPLDPGGPGVPQG